MIYIVLANQRGAVQVDDADAYEMSKYNWHLRRSKKDHTSYAATGDNIYMHQLLCPGAERVDHIDGDGLNNQRANLRPCTHAENMRNTRPYRGKRFKGVTYRASRDKWEAYIKPPGEKQQHLGTYTTEEEAAQAYDTAALEYFGEFARLNFPLGFNSGVEEYNLPSAQQAA